MRLINLALLLVFAAPSLALSPTAATRMRAGAVAAARSGPPCNLAHLRTDASERVLCVTTLMNHTGAPTQRAVRAQVTTTPRTLAGMWTATTS